ncbi:hypothetical protein C942_03242 [Photobacterium marinum]|uniref:Uncharacterized protein n=1 Tax=Photobacterium marinum TaxID=1056511 RepID=L8J8V4_9GAMM|nr:hypothetical protein C942_03242 [Photobacterium marinum]
MYFVAASFAVKAVETNALFVALSLALVAASFAVKAFS